MKHCWNVSVSPRSPSKLCPELAKLSELDGSINNRNFQERFTTILTSLEEFQGAGSDNNESFSARDRMAPMQTYGFIFIDDDDVIHITGAGWALVNAKTEVERQDVWLRQLLKWQFPSPQHSSKEYYRDDGFLGTSGFDLKPFIATLEMVLRLDGMTKIELAMFALTKIDMSSIAKWCTAVVAYREIRDGLPPGNLRKRFAQAALEMIYAERERVYQPSKTPTPRSAMDYADALFRLLRMTGLFTVSKGRIIVAPERLADANAILSKKWPLRHDWDDPEEFYEYYGDPTLPRLPWQDTETLRQRVREMWSRTTAELNAATFAVPANASMLVPKEADIAAGTYAQLQLFYSQLLELLKLIRITAMLGTLRSTEGLNEVIEFFNRLTRRGDPQVYDPPSQLEWNCWRAMLALDHTDNVKANFTMDTTLEPLTRAPGNGPDGVASFDAFDIIFEPTLKTGPKQWNDESEPIYRHVVKHTNALRESGDNRDVYTFAIAPKIEPALSAYFLSAAKGTLPIPEMREPPLIVPITITQMQDLLGGAAAAGGFQRDELWLMFESIKERVATISLGDIGSYDAIIQDEIDQLISAAAKDRALAVIGNIQ